MRARHLPENTIRLYIGTVEQLAEHAATDLLAGLDRRAVQTYVSRAGVLRSYSEVNGRRCDAVIYSLIRSGLGV